MDVRKKDLIQFYQKKRLFLFLDEWGFYFTMILMHGFGFSMIFTIPIFLYGSIALYTSYKNIDKVESLIVPIDQDLFSYKDLFSLIKYSIEECRKFRYKSIEPPPEDSIEPPPEDSIKNRSPLPVGSKMSDL